MKAKIFIIDDFTKYEGKPLSFAVNGYGSNEHIATESLLTKLKMKHFMFNRES